MPKRNLAWILIVAAIALLMWQLPQMIAGRDSVIQAFGPLVDARRQIQTRYVDKVDDERIVRDAVESAIHTMVRDLGDPHAIYLNQADYETFLKRTDGLYGGVGVEVWATDRGLEVLSREPNSPAVSAGIRPGDIITHIDGRKMRGVPIFEAVNNILNGPVDTTVQLRVVRPDGDDPAPRDLTVSRRVIKLNPVHGWSRAGAARWRYMLDEERRIGYIRLVKFTTDIDDRLDEEMNRLLSAGLRGLILDLRENTGGLLDSAREVADRFLDGGLIVKTGGRKADTKQWFASREGTYPPIPLVVLVNGTTASAAEIVAGALRDHRRAFVVGERTYGKGSVQEVVELAGRHGAIKLTTAYYYLPNGECIHRSPEAEKNGSWGVTPNQVVALTPEERKRWEVAWREIAREVSAPDPADNEAESPNEPTTQSRPEAEEAEPESAVAQAAARLLESDVQLKAAYDILRKRLSPQKQDAAAGRSASAE